MPGLNVLVSGMSGPIGTALLPALATAGHRVTRLVRRAARREIEIQWDPAQPLSPQAFSGFDAVIHFAGESIVGRWTAAKKVRIRDSRVLGTRHLVEALTRAASKPSVLITASAIGYYGNRGSEILTEPSAPGDSFLASVCKEWEAAALAAETSNIRVVPMRMGVVLSSSGGALKQMLPPFRMGLGGRLANGKQYWSWVSVHDVVAAILHVMKHDGIRGPANMVSPNPVTNAEFTRVLASVLHRPAPFPMPAFVVRALFGQMGDELLLASARVLPEKLLSSSYEFRQSDLAAALIELLANT